MNNEEVLIALVSDLHLGTKQYGIKERYYDFLRSFHRFGEDVAKKVDAVVIGGDLFDSPHPDAHSVLVAQQVIGDIQDQGTPVFGIDGNHDLSGGDWLSVVGAQPLPDMVPMTFKGIRILGLNYRNGRDLVAALQQLADEGEKVDIVVAHFGLAEMIGGGSADTGVQELSPILEQMGVKCVLMGHVHIPDCRKWNGILYVNPGSTEMKSSNEPKDKYYFILNTKTWEAEPVPLKTRRIETVEITAAPELEKFQETLIKEAKDTSNGLPQDRQFYQVLLDDSIEDAYNRLAKTVHDTDTLARIVMRAHEARDVKPVDRKEGMNTLESAVESCFPKDSDEAKLILSFLRSPDPASIDTIVERYMKEGL